MAEGLEYLPDDRRGLGRGRYEAEPCIPIGEPNTAFAQYFVGQSYLKPLTMEQVPIFNVTFEPGCRNNWHIHHADNGGGQLLICIYGKGWYQEWGKEARELYPGEALARCGKGQLVPAYRTGNLALPS